MIKNNAFLVGFLIFGLLMTGCNTPGKNGRDIYSDYDDDENIDLTGAVTITGDLAKIVNPPLLKKIDMYNAGCINPVEYYDRDMEYAKALNFNSMRVDLSAGKTNGNGGRYLVGEDYQITTPDEQGNYQVKKESLTYDFTEFDQLVSYFDQMGALPYMSWCYIPYPLQQEGTWKKFDRKVTNWQEIWEEVYYQYAKHCLDEQIKIGYHEIYNEPDLEMIRWWDSSQRDSFAGFLDYEDFAPNGDPSKGKYFDMYKYGVQGILRGDPEATVGGPAYAIGQTAAWGGLISKVASQKIPMDFFSFHSYMDGQTWYLSESQRASGAKNEMEQIVQELTKYSHYLKTQLHISEFSPLNDDNGAKEGLNSPFNTYRGAARTFTGLDEVINRTNVQLISWAQLMSVNSNKNDAYGVIDKNGYIKSSYNALKIYQDMPVWRYGVSSNNNDGIKTYVTADNDKVSILLWNTNSSYDEEGKASTKGDRLVRFNLNNCWLDNATRRVYRIDEAHATSYDLAENAELVAQNVRTYNHTDEKVWGGMIPAEGTVYITINRGSNRDFYVNCEPCNFANDIKTEYWYEDRFRQIKGNDEHYEDYADDIHGSFAQFNRKTWTAYLGMGDCAGKRDGTAKNQGVALTSVTCDDLPSKFTIKTDIEGFPSGNLDYSNLGVRIDFYNDNTSKYEKSVFLHNGIYSSADYRLQDSALSKEDAFPFGTKKACDADKKYDENASSWEVDLSNLAPSSWMNGSKKAAISFYMRNTGLNTRASFQFVEEK